MYGASNRDRPTHFCLSHNNWSVCLTKATYVRRTGRIPNGMWSGRTYLQDFRIFISDTGTHLSGMTPKNSLGLAKPPPHWCQKFPLLFVQMGYDLLCGLWVWRRRRNCGPCCPPMSNPSTSSCTARPDGSGRWDNRIAAQHLPRDLVQPGSGLNFEELVQMKKN